MQAARRFVWRFAEFSQREHGSVAIIFALAIVPILLAAGGAIDFSRAQNFKTSLQEALDSGILAGARDGSSGWAQIATSTFQSNVRKAFGAAGTPTYTKISSETYAGTASGNVKTVFLGLIHIATIPVTVQAGAIAAGADNSCILTLDHGQPYSHVSLSLNGAPVINLAGCSIRSNTSLDCNGHDGNLTSSFASGTAAACSVPTSNAPPVPDVYAALASNIATVCGSNRPGVTWVAGSVPLGSAIQTVNAGGRTEYHVCGDLVLSGTGDLLVTASPTSDSVIVIENGSLAVASGAAISTTRTALVLTGNNSYSAATNFPNGNGQSASLTLSAPTDSSNPWQGVALYLDPKLTYRVDDRWGPGATLNAEGLVYLGNANVVTDGNTGSNDSKCSKFVMNSFTTNGSVNLDLKQQVSACGQIGLKQWDGIVVRLTH